MPKCSRCGRKGFFLKLENGLCSNCVAITKTETEIKELSEKKDILQGELDRISEKLSDSEATYRKLAEEARQDGAKQAEKEMADKIAESKRILQENLSQATAAESRQLIAMEAERKSEKSVASADKKIRKFKELLSSVQNAIDMSATDYPESPEEISRLLSELDDLLSPSVKVELQCLGMRDLRKRYKENEKLILEVLDKYKARYTTKANSAIYALTTIAAISELQNVLANLKFGNLEKSVDQMKEFMQKFYLIAADGNQSIAPTMRKFIGELEYLFGQSIHIEYEYYVQKERAKEEQRAIREQMRQEAEERRALEAERKKVEKEEAKYTDQINQVQEQLHATSDVEKITQLESRLKELQAQKAQVEEKKEQIITLQNGKAGNVYVISNLGAFGDDVFKIGMTRRAEPQDRVDELGSASVPFPFDVHSFIFSDDAVGLENKIHKILNDRRVNKVNLRKEFFRISIDELEQLVTELEPTAEFRRTMVAEQYRQSQSITVVSENPEDGMDEEDD